MPKFGRIEVDDDGYKLDGESLPQWLCKELDKDILCAENIVEAECCIYWSLITVPTACPPRMPLQWYLRKLARHVRRTYEWVP